MTTSPVTSVKGVKSVKVQPSAIFSIFDQFQRRSELCTGRLIGAIFGTRSEDSEGLITVSQAFPIPHSEINDQVNINSEYYKNRAELLRTCYGRSQYILGWYSIAMKGSVSANENFAITSSFIHDIFSKEVIKSSPVNVADSAVHLEIVIEDDCDRSGIKYSALMATGKNGNVFEFASVPNCEIEYAKEETFVARSLLHSLKNSSTGTVSLPSAKEFNEASLKEFSELLSKLKSSPSVAGEDLLKHLPDSAAYQKQAEKFKSELRGVHEMVKLLCDQLRESQKLYLQSSNSN